jgi:hypothetical protein
LQKIPSRLQRLYDSSYKSAILDTLDQDLKEWAGKTRPINRSAGEYEPHRATHLKDRSSFRTEADAYAEAVLGKQRGAPVKIVTTENQKPESPDKARETVVPGLNLSVLDAHTRFPALGSRVKVHSLRMMPKFNGEVGTVQGTTDDQRVEVLLDAFPDTLTCIKPDNLLPVTREAAPTGPDSATSQVDYFVCV